jgi:four helix bundle protein
MGSLAELDTQVEIAIRQSLLDPDQGKQVSEQIQEIRRMLFGLINSLK